MRPRLALQVAGIEARARMGYRVDFWLNAVVSFGAELVLVWFLWKAMFAESALPRIGGYGFEAMVVYYVTVLLVAKVVRGQEFEDTVSQDIYQGNLNRYLVFPASYAAFKYAQRLGTLVPAGVQALIFAAVALPLLGGADEFRVTGRSVAMAVPAIALASLLYFLMDFVIHLVAFWADNVWSLDAAKTWIATLLGGFLLPLTVFPDWAQPALRVLPFRYCFGFPVRVLLGEIPPAEWLAGLGTAAAWCLVLALASALVWRRGQLQYTGVGM